MQMIQVLIGIQARSTSTRLPGKCFEKLGGKRILDHVIDAVLNASHYLNRRSEKTGVYTKALLLIPEGDPIEKEFQRKIPIFKGSELDVLSRYVSSAKEIRADYIVRITADCPLIKPDIISRHVTAALANKYDYLTNAHENYRTSPDGQDCEVMSIRALDYIAKNAESDSDKEHVTTFLKRNPPDWLTAGVVIDRVDFSDIKLSVDTPEDLQEIKKRYERGNQIYERALKTYGKRSVHVF